MGLLICVDLYILYIVYYWLWIAQHFFPFHKVGFWLATGASPASSESQVGYLPDGTPMNKAGNCINHPETIGPDPHAPGRNNQAADDLG